MIAAVTSGIRREIRFLAQNFWDLALVSWIPLLLMIVTAWQFSSGVMRDLPIAVVDQDNSALGRKLVQRLEAAPGLHVIAQPPDMLAAEGLARSRKVYAIVLVPNSTQKNILWGEPAFITAYYNASYSTAGAASSREIGAAVRSLGAVLAVADTAAIRGSQSVRQPPVTAQATNLFNPQTSYELQLVSLIHPALLHLIFMVCVIGALGRELRDKTIGEWLDEYPKRRSAAVAGKLIPYFAIFMAWSAAALIYIAAIRGWGVAGSSTIIMFGYFVMYLAYAGVAIVIVGVTASMAQSLSTAGLYAGASFAFAGAIFPIESASGFAQIWSALLPYTAFAKLHVEQLSLGTPGLISVRQILVMLIFFVVGFLIGMPAYLRAARQPKTWGRR